MGNILILEIIEFIAIGSALGGGIFGTFLWKKKRNKKDSAKGLDLIHKKIEDFYEIIELKLKRLENTNLRDVFLMNRIALKELYNEITLLKNYDIHQTELNRLEEIMIRLEELIVIKEESQEVEEIILGLIVKSVKLVKILIKTKEDEINYQKFEDELLKKDVANDLIKEYEKESMKNQFTNEFLEMKKEWVTNLINGKGTGYKPNPESLDDEDINKGGSE